MRWLVAMVALVLAGVLLATSLLTALPLTGDQQATAMRLEAVVPLVEELGIEIWVDDPDCRSLVLDLDERFADPPHGPCAFDEQPFTPAARTAFDRLAAAVAGIVPGARVRMVSIAEDYSDVPNDEGPPSRSVSFDVAPQVLRGMDSPLTEWTWTWYEDEISPGPDDLSLHWSFESGRPNRG
jgi:hypothetical protein